MNKILVFAVLAAFLFAGLAEVNAIPGPPMIVAIKVHTPNAPYDSSGVEVAIVDKTHPNTVIRYTNENGEISDDWNMMSAKPQDALNDDIEVTALGKTVTVKMTENGLNDGNLLHIYPNLDCPKVTVPEDTTPYSLETCPVKEVVVEVPIEKECASFPENGEYDSIIGFLAAVAAVVAAAIGIKSSARLKLTPYYKIKVYRKDRTYYYTWRKLTKDRFLSGEYKKANY